MEEMKFVENQRINKKVVEIVKKLKEEVITKFHPKSIILSGSFGKGEVTVVEDGGNLKFLSDCEVTIISNKIIFNRDKIKQFSKKFYEKTSLKVVMGGVVMGIYLQLPFLSRKLKPTMENYDLKYGSKVIYGKDYLEKIPNFKPEDIPLWEGIRLLFNRMAESLEHFSVEKPSEEMVFWTNKIVLACQDALLLSMGEYHYSYRKRNEMFQNLFLEHFNELEDEIPNFLDLTLEATERKLNGKKNVDDPIKYWFDTAKICDRVFRFIIGEDMSITFDTYLEFQEKYIEHPNIKKKYYRGLSPNPIYQNLRSAEKMWIFDHKTPTIKLMQKCMIPWAHVVYSMIPIIYFSLSESAKVDKVILKRVRDIIQLFEKKMLLRNPNPLEEWKYIMEKTVNLWRLMCC